MELPEMAYLHYGSQICRACSSPMELLGPCTLGP
jgi:hypothetical protein